MSKTIALTITEEEYAELEALLDTYIAEIKRDKDEHKPSQQPKDQDLSDHANYSRQLAEENRLLNERALRLESELQHQKEQHALERERWQERQATEREYFRLQLENFILRVQCGLPLPAFPAFPAESVH
jgi:hypothetical protein